MSSPTEVVRGFFERMEARQWDSAGELLSPSLHIEYTATGEVFDGDNFLAMNRAYPDGWTIRIVETIAEGNRVAAHVSVQQDNDTFRCAGFYEIANGVIESGVEHWVTERSEAPPVWRQEFVS